MAIRLVISGCCGRMGRAIASLALQDSVFAVAAALEAPGNPSLGQDYGTLLGRPTPLGVRVSDDAKAGLAQGDVLIEFTAPDATLAHAALAKQLKKPMVIGTTGLTDAQVGQLRAAAEAIPIVCSPNMSVGVNVLYELARTAVQRLGPGYDVAVVESHHRGKKDSHSGTAKRLAAVLAEARGGTPVPVQAIRAGDIVGDHTVILAGPAERLELTHRAHSREVFAQGALRAARFLAGRTPGLYDMADVLKG